MAKKKNRKKNQGRHYEASEWVDFEIDGMIEGIVQESSLSASDVEGHVHHTDELDEAQKAFTSHANRVVTAWMSRPPGSTSGLEGTEDVSSEDDIAWNTWAGIVGHGVGFWENIVDSDWKSLKKAINSDKKLTKAYEKLQAEMDNVAYAAVTEAGGGTSENPKRGKKGRRNPLAGVKIRGQASTEAAAMKEARERVGREGRPMYVSWSPNRQKYLIWEWGDRDDPDTKLLFAGNNGYMETLIEPKGKESNPWEKRKGVPYTKKADAQAFADFISKSSDVRNVRLIKEGDDWRVAWEKERSKRKNPVSKKEFEQYFKDEVMPEIARAYEKDGVPDKPARREIWNNTVDDYIRDGLLPRSAGDWSHPKWLETYRPKGRNPNGLDANDERLLDSIVLIAENDGDAYRDNKNAKRAVAKAFRDHAKIQADNLRESRAVVEPLAIKEVRRRWKTSNPTKGRANAGGRQRNSHDPDKSADDFYNYLNAADRELTTAVEQLHGFTVGEALKKKRVGASITGLILAGYWTGRAREARDYAGRVTDSSDKRLKELEKNLKVWGSNFDEWIKKAA